MGSKISVEHESDLHSLVTGGATSASNDIRKKVTATVENIAPNKLEQLVGILSSADTLEQLNFNATMLKQCAKNNKIKVKLVVVDLEKWESQRMAAFIVANISNLNGWTKYGLVHTGVQIGAKIVHWFNDSIVHFTEIKAKAAKLAVHVGELSLDDPADLAKLRQLCTIAVNYNLNKIYDNKTCNCHTFAEDVLNCLQFDCTVDRFGGQMGNYLKRLRTTLLDKEFVCPLTGKKYVFTTHAELDCYANELFKNGMPMHEFQLKYSSDFTLLKAFDRAFWLGKMHEDQALAKNVKKVIQFAESDCPFLDPCGNSFTKLN